MSKEKILIIDDDADFVAATQLVLEANGYMVSSAGNKEQGINVLRDFTPNLIILDVMMEKMCDGFDLSRELKKDKAYKDIPILMLTAVGDETGFDFCTEAGDRDWLPVNDYVKKPVKPEELISKIEKLLTGGK